ncbi:transposase [Lipingzhangella halophila]|uniref:transposase n=1 Tax=Lipingzhangella halophila TaxID=1783352 RepID=UPI0035E3F799
MGERTSRCTCSPATVSVIKERRGPYFASFVVEADAEPLPETADDVGIDLGRCHFAALSDGTKVSNPRFLRRAEKKLTKASGRCAARPRVGEPGQGPEQDRQGARAHLDLFWVRNHPRPGCHRVDHCARRWTETRQSAGSGELKRRAPAARSWRSPRSRGGRWGKTTTFSGVGAPARETGTSGRREAHRADSREAAGIPGSSPRRTSTGQIG